MKWGLVAGIGVGAIATYIYAQAPRSKTRKESIRVRKFPSAAARHGFREGYGPAETEQPVSGPQDLLTIINEWPRKSLMEIEGIGPVLASRIISHRPYKTAEELLGAKLLPPAAIKALQSVAS